MPIPHSHAPAIWIISLASIALILIRPGKWPEAVWACAGAVILVLSGLLSPAAALHAIGEGLDVYLFLIGMMIVSELARREGVFDWLASRAVRASRSSQRRLFALVYAVGVAVTTFLSNDATAVVLTPAVLAAVKAAGTEPLPYLFACAFIANAASFVLPISNPANLVVYHGHMPTLAAWLGAFALPSAVSIGVTYFVLRWVAHAYLSARVSATPDVCVLAPRGRVTLAGIAVLAMVLTTCSAMDVNLGAPACAVGIATAAVVSICDHSTPRELAKEISWAVLPLVAGLFVIVEALDRAGALTDAVEALNRMKAWPLAEGALASGFGVAFVSNVMNNLPSGLISAAAIQTARLTGALRDSVLIGVDLGPNLSVTGSLATILWLIAIRREGLHISFWSFLKWGALVMPPALLLSILILVCTHS